MRARWFGVLQLALVLVLVLAWSLGVAAWAEEEPAAAPEAEAPAFVPVPLVAARSEELLASLRQTAEDLQKDPAVVAIEGQLPELQEALARESAETATLLAGSPTIDQLSDREQAWGNRRRELAIWRETLTTRAAAVEADLAALDLQRELWKQTRKAARGSSAPTEVLASIDTNLAAIRQTRKRVAEYRAGVLSLLNTVGREDLRASEARAALVSTGASMRRRIFEPDALPLWQALASQDAEGIPGGLGDSIESDAREFVEFLRRDDGSPLPALLGFAVALCAAWVVRARLRQRHESPALAGSAQFFERPVSIALICTFFVGVVAYPFAPPFATELAGALLVVPIMRVLLPVVPPVLRPMLYVLAAFYLVDRVRDGVDGEALVERCLFLLQTLAGAAFLIWLLRPSRRSRFPVEAEKPPVFVLQLLWLAAALLGVSAAANLLGFMTLSRVLGEGVLRTAYVTMLLYAAYRIAVTIVLVFFSAGATKRLYLVQLRGPQLLSGARVLLSLGLALVWAYLVLDAFGVGASIARSAATFLGEPLTFGSFSISLGAVLGAAVVFVVAILGSRGLRVLLEEEVLPRLALGRGVANAVSTTAYYAVLLGGFFLAISAAGVDLSRFTILAGALGVGIGFGLQNVVNNFVSGLILLFERPIQVGDTIEIGGLLGHVKRIGTRASTVRTYQGAEVIVPNGNLISTEVTNWTLSDPYRRVDLAVGVAYGNRPARVIEVLAQVFEGEPRILRDPKPLVLFRGFGDSSLDFEVRFWARDPDTYLQLSSDVASHVYDLLHEAGIEIPFPQRDLHLKSTPDSTSASASRREEGEVDV